MREDVHDVAQARWGSILPALGVPLRALNGRHQACPMCGGKDRFRYDNKDGRGTWICNQCGAGNGVDLVMKLNGWSFQHAADTIRAMAGGEPREQPPEEITEEERRTALRQLWQGSKPMQEGDLADTYLRSRGIVLDVYPKALRLCEQCPIKVGKGVRAPRRAPALIAAVVGQDGKGASLHRTFLASDGSAKADMEAPRKLMPGPLPDGACVRLSEPSETLGVAEGIESALAAAQRFRLPVWAVLNASMMEKWEAPEGTTDVAIFADNDGNFHGQKAAFALANRLVRYGVSATVNVPPVVGEDWNDVLLREQGG